ncbi:hypothetical protein [Actinoallomurus rhizosphaericola]|uniref:hypothetical protein n=1 Tax=Actinoallomurus rhizosphaericola TaxID=2952536 RepID=UPI002093E169|nr:hypothetical protein [Actinoallomurus rhizosphaericola]MCO5995343.1 hypothetical protein [Actinoallomurus rhizosphaericola]
MGTTGEPCGLAVPGEPVGCAPAVVPERLTCGAVSVAVGSPATGAVPAWASAADAVPVGASVEDAGVYPWSPGGVGAVPSTLPGWTPPAAGWPDSA